MADGGQQQFKLSYWHSEIARLIGEGLPNREIKKVVNISDSRLSILRANPLIKRAAERYRQMHEDKYRKALETFADGAESTAKAVISMVTNPLVPANTKLAAAQMILEHASYMSPEGKNKQSGEEVVFEQMLRVTKRGAGQYADSNADFDADHAAAELTGDLKHAEVIDTDTDPAIAGLSINPLLV